MKSTSIDGLDVPYIRPWRKWKKVSEWNSPKLATDLRSRLPAGRSFKQRVSTIDIDTLSTKKR